MYIKLLIIILCLSLLCGCAHVMVYNDLEDGQAIKVSDKGQDYIDSFIFIGESTTYHLKSRGVLSGGKNTTQVWGNESGTLNMSLNIDSTKIIYPETGEHLTFCEAAAKKRPERVLLCFGLNGATQNIRKGEEYYKTCYKKLINAIREGSPATEIILASGYPVAKNMDMSLYSVSIDTLNEYIETINSWTQALAREEGLKYLDTASVLKDEKGRLRDEYQVGDGHHLTKEAYEKILQYIRIYG